MGRIRTEFLLVAVQLAALAFILGVPNLRAFGDLVSSGFATSATVVALLAVLVWTGTIVLAVVVLVRALRAVDTPRRRSAVVPLLALAVGVSCLGVGIARHQSATFQPCCGSLERAQSLLKTGR